MGDEDGHEREGKKTCDGGVAEDGSTNDLQGFATEGLRKDHIGSPQRGTSPGGTKEGERQEHGVDPKPRTGAGFGLIEGWLNRLRILVTEELGGNSRFPFGAAHGWGTFKPEIK